MKNEEKYEVTIFFRDETDRVYRKEFEYENNIENSLYALFKWANKFGAEKIFFRKKNI